MSNINLPFIANSQSVRVAVDPITRIEGHLRIEAQITNGVVVDAWSAAPAFRGIESILIGRDPRETWVYTQRLCGVCTTVHAIAAVRAVENALGITIPDNARLVRNLMEAAQFVQDHVIHFYHLHALDWVDVVACLAADPAQTAALQQSLSAWPNNTAAYFAGVQTRIKTLVDSGQLGPFANGYWGHPAYKLPAEVNLLAVAHYLVALDWQRDFIKVQAILGGKNPHPQTYLVGGTALAIDPASANAFNASRISQLRTLVTGALNFVSQVYMPDLQAIASYYKDWAGYGGGPGNYLACGDLPADNTGQLSALALPRGVIYHNAIGSAPQALDEQQIKEYVTRSWYHYSGGDATSLHPSAGETNPAYSGPQPPYTLLNVDQKYSWLKAPRYNDQPMEVGPLARMLVAYAAGNPRVHQLVDGLLANLGVGAAALFSTLGRVAARGVETQYVVEKMNGWIDELEANMNGGRLTIQNGTRWNPSTWPANAAGLGMTEAPRGAVGHWIGIAGGKVSRYQAVVATAWNGSPRDGHGVRGVWEQALIGTPIADPDRPVEILRTIHSFDPCMACAVHVIDGRGQRRPAVQVSVHGASCRG